jgi:enoyl-CoA hydratase/carnithine racemase
VTLSLSRAESVLFADIAAPPMGLGAVRPTRGGLGLVPGAGAMQHLSRLMGRGRALAVMLSG